MLQFNDKTISYLKTMSQVNDTILLKEGTKQFAIGPNASTIIIVDFDQAFPVDFGVKDMSRLLGLLTTLKEPAVEFNNGLATISSSGFSATFRECSHKLIDKVAEDQLNGILETPSLVVFNLPSMVLANMIKLAGINDLTHLGIIQEGQVIKIEAFTSGNDTTNRATFVIAEDAPPVDKKVMFVIEVSNLKLLPDDYQVVIHEPGFAHFKASNNPVQYVIATEIK